LELISNMFDVFPHPACLNVRSHPFFSRDRRLGISVLGEDVQLDQPIGPSRIRRLGADGFWGRVNRTLHDGGPHVGGFIGSGVGGGGLGLRLSGHSLVISLVLYCASRSIPNPVASTQGAR
jgi:hypothetical protein